MQVWNSAVVCRSIPLLVLWVPWPQPSAMLTGRYCRSMWLGQSPCPVSQPGHQTAKKNKTFLGCVFAVWHSLGLFNDRENIIFHTLSPGCHGGLLDYVFWERLSLSVTFHTPLVLGMSRNPDLIWMYWSNRAVCQSYPQLQSSPSWHSIHHTPAPTQCVHSAVQHLWSTFKTFIQGQFHKKGTFCHIHDAKKMPWYLIDMKCFVTFFHVSSTAKNS